MPKYAVAALVALMTFVPLAQAHDTWVQTNTNLIRVGDAVHIDLVLGNHGNEHRDFKVAGKVDPQSTSLDVVLPDGKVVDVKDRLRDVGYAPAEGFWTTQFVAAAPGMYLVAQLSDQVLSYGPVRGIKGGKTCFVVSPSLDKVSQENPGFDRPLGHPLELVPLSNPVTPMGPGASITVQLLYHGKPLADSRVSFIPRGETLTKELDSRYERMTDAKGQASFTPNASNYYLIAAHRDEPNEKGKDYHKTKYSATLTLFVPKICPCCNQ
jgi:uncharacterized GH25 family protein